MSMMEQCFSLSTDNHSTVNDQREMSLELGRDSVANKQQNREAEAGTRGRETHSLTTTIKNQHLKVKAQVTPVL